MQGQKYIALVHADYAQANQSGPRLYRPDIYTIYIWPSLERCVYLDVAIQTTAVTLERPSMPPNCPCLGGCIYTCKPSLEIDPLCAPITDMAMAVLLVPVL